MEKLVLSDIERYSARCTECGWEGVRGDCNFGHDDVYCPQCGRESIETAEFALKE